MRNLKACALIVASLVCNPGVCGDGDYDRLAHIKTLPLEPMFPTEEWQCAKYAEAANARLQEVILAHDKCLRADTKKPWGGLPVESEDKCTNSACQDLHSARSKFKKEIDTEVSSCRAQVLEVQKKEEESKRAKRQQRLQDAQSNPCIREWIQYEALCTGEKKWDSQAQQKKCQLDLNDLRRRCPNRGG